MYHRKIGCEVWAGFIWLRKGSGGRSCEYSNEPSVSIKCGNFLDQLSGCHLLKKRLCLMEIISRLVSSSVIGFKGTFIVTSS